ncbi:peptidase dimerization domain protein [Ancylostoma caninum]|uniref:Peptidase dimerization domain protein n=1 Tax=Ancylostoma caninum TaxID=29170 RepID=A0A368GGH8_ANCCA|nr:peptidase dimerization domain protein [Ancylostoma caninum]
MACMVSAAQSLVDSHPEIAAQVALLFVVGEEVDHVGMQVIVKCKGKAGHSGYPSEGESAIHKLIPVLNDVLNYKWPSDDTYGKYSRSMTLQRKTVLISFMYSGQALGGTTTVNIGIIEGGQAQNAWAENAYARIFVRVTTSVADVQKKLEDIVAGRASIEVTSYNEPVVLSNPPIPLPTDQVAFNTDLPYYSRLSSLRGKYLFGAGTIKVAHSQREFVPKCELHACKEALIALVLKLCS